MADLIVNIDLLQTGTGAQALPLGDAVGLLYFTPEQFGAAETYSAAVDDTAHIQAAIDAAANWASAGYARRVLLSRMYKTTATILKRPYVSIYGVGMARCGLLPTMSSGPAMDCDSVANTSAAYLDEFKGFRIDGTNVTGAAYALRLRGQKQSRWSLVGFWNFTNSSSHAVQIWDGCYAIVFDQCYWLANSRHQKIAAANVASTFPTTITHRSCTFEGGTLHAGEAVHILDASGITYDQDCIFQSNGQKYLFLVENGPIPSTQNVHRWLNCYFEDNGGGQTGAQTWRLMGASPAGAGGSSPNPLTGCEIRGSKVHGAAPAGGHIHAQWTERLAVFNNFVPPNHAWVVDGSGNSAYDIDARFVGTCEIQTVRYNTTNFVFTDMGTVTTPQDGILKATVTKPTPAKGRYDVTFNRNVKSTATFIQATAFDARGDAMSANAYFENVSTMKVIVNAVGTATGETPSRVSVTVTAEIEPA